MKNKKLIIIVLAFVALVGLVAGLWFGLQAKENNAPAGASFTVTVVHGDGSQKEFSYTTEGEKLGAVLEAEGLILPDTANPGMFHTVDGEKADWNENQSYWAFYVGEEYAMTGIYDTDIVDGTNYKLVYTIG